MTFRPFAGWLCHVRLFHICLVQAVSESGTVEGQASACGVAWCVIAASSLGGEDRKTGDIQSEGVGGGGKRLSCVPPQVAAE